VGFARRGWVLRTGAAVGADQAFIAGALSVPGSRAEIFLPWPGFESGCLPDPARPFWCVYHGLGLGRASVADTVAVARATHPAWDRLTRGARALHSRNVYQVLGDDLRSPVRGVVCWTADGADGSPASPVTIDTGGTGTAIRLAAARGLPVLNLSRADHRARLAAWLARPPSGG
jgi:hypothetical protein